MLSVLLASIVASVLPSPYDRPRWIELRGGDVDGVRLRSGDWVWTGTDPSEGDWVSLSFINGLFLPFVIAEGQVLTMEQALPFKKAREEALSAFKTQKAYLLSRP